MSFGGSGSGLAPSASEFVPGQYSFTSNNSSSRESVGITTPKLQTDSELNAELSSELNSAASEWVPASGLNSMQDMSTAVREASGSAENMVEVNWNGSIIFVPESSTYFDDTGVRVYAGGDGEVTPAGDIATDGVAAVVAPVEQEGLQWAQFASTLPAPPKRSLQTIGIPEPVRHHFRTIDIEALKQMNPENERYKELPMRYHSAYPLFNPHSSPAAGAAQGVGSSCFGYPTALYKVTDQMDSQLYALRRFDNVRVAGNIVTNVAQRWHDVRHPGIVSLYGVFLEKGALFFSYMYHAGAQTLKERYIDQRGPLLGESLLWRLLIQLMSTTRHIHGRGLAVRVVEPAHIILTSGTCARFSSVGVLDVLEFETRKSLGELQQDDLVKLGRVVLSLMTRTVITSKNAEEALGLMKQHYSSDLQRVVGALLSGKLTIFQICNNQTVNDRIHEELDTAMAAADGLHSMLRNEYENGRMLRLLMKLGFVNERPSDASNPMLPSWSETGDQYVLKLFRDHVFHQVDVNGLPILDAGHVVTALNKLDAGDPEEILLSSRDGKDLLVVSYADVQRCLESSFLELAQQSQVALSNAAAGAPTAGVSGLHHQSQIAGSGGRASVGMNASMGPPLHGAYAGRDAGYGVTSGRNSNPRTMNSVSSGNLMHMNAPGSAGMNASGMGSGSRGYNSIGSNLNLAGGMSGGGSTSSGGYGASGYGNVHAQAVGNSGMYGMGYADTDQQYGNDAALQGYGGGGAHYASNVRYGGGGYSGY